MFEPDEKTMLGSLENTRYMKPKQVERRLAFGFDVAIPLTLPRSNEERMFDLDVGYLKQGETGPLSDTHSRRAEVACCCVQCLEVL